MLSAFLKALLMRQVQRAGSEKRKFYPPIRCTRGHKVVKFPLLGSSNQWYISVEVHILTLHVWCLWKCFRWKFERTTRVGKGITHRLCVLRAISDWSSKTKSQTSPNTALSDANDAFSTRHNMFPFGKTGDYINSRAWVRQPVPILKTGFCFH